jgi:type IV secretory pathway TraG/TraD family ATPase VirD4
MQNRREILSPIISSLLALASFEILSWSDVHETHKVTFMIDEFAMLPRLKPIEALLRAGRSKGCGVVIGTQDFHSISSIYGDDAKSIMNAASNRFFFRLNDPSEAELASQNIGDVKVLIKSKTQFYNESSDDVSMTFSENTSIERLVFLREFMQLQPGECYFKLFSWPESQYAFAKFIKYSFTKKNEKFLE